MSLLKEQINKNDTIVQLDYILVLPDIATRKIIEESILQSFPVIQKDLKLNSLPKLIFGFPSTEIPLKFDNSSQTYRTGIDAAISQAKSLCPKDGTGLILMFGSTASWLLWDPKFFMGKEIKVINGYPDLLSAINHLPKEFQSWARTLTEGVTRSFLGENTAKNFYKILSNIYTKKVCDTFGTNNIDLVKIFVSKIDKMDSDYTEDLLKITENSRINVLKNELIELIFLRQELVGTTQSQRKEVAKILGLSPKTIKVLSEINGVVPAKEESMRMLLEEILKPFIRC